MTHPYLRTAGPIAFAHRGGNRHAPENTIAAFEHAVSLGYRYLETDVHLSADGALVAFHDADLSRTCGIEAKIGELTLDQIAELRVDGVAPIPLMRDLLQRWPDHRFNIDCKSDQAVPVLVDLIQEFDALGRVSLGSFSLRRLRRLRRLLGPELLTNMSPVEVALLRYLGVALGNSQRSAQVPVATGRLTIVNEKFVQRARRRGIAVHVWTVNEADEMNRLLDLGVGGVMTDDVELLREQLVSRGDWPD